MINAIPIVGWLISVFLVFGLSVPFWFFWTYMELGSKYLGMYIPEHFIYIPFWDCFGLITLITIFNCFIPKFVSVTQTK